MNQGSTDVTTGTSQSIEKDAEHLVFRIEVADKEVGEEEFTDGGERPKFRWPQVVRWRLRW